MGSDMRLLVVHNHYLSPGGEDQVYRTEIDLLRNHGVEVSEYSVHNNQIASMNKIALGINTIWSQRAFQKMRTILAGFQPHLVHFHNIFPLLSPSVYYACHSASIPTVQTLHNYRLICASATLFRNGRSCQDCLNKPIPWPGIFHSCYQNSYLASFDVVAMLVFHRILSTWTHRIDCYIALTEFARQLFLSCGFPADKIAIKPNFVTPDPGSRQGDGLHALFIGRLSSEKGLATLLNSWRSVQQIPLHIAGEGPERVRMRQYIHENQLDKITIKGQVERNEVIELIKDARFIVFPSQFFEGFPLVLAESFACGVPVIASRLGAMAEIVTEGKTGLLFTPGDAEDLAAKVEWAWNHPAEMAEMGKAARREYEEKYTAERNYEMLMEIYRKAIENHRRRR
jgi:glycosyltransferase involved in cell wall biosynthesis